MPLRIGLGPVGVVLPYLINDNNQGGIIHYFSIQTYNRSLFAGISTSYVIKQLVHAFSCEYIELWMHLGSLESTHGTILSRAIRLYTMPTTRIVSRKIKPTTSLRQSHATRKMS